jgi:hypothetical protein
MFTPAEAIPQDQAHVYSAVLREANSRGIPFALAGAFAVGTYTGSWRNTKDMDLCILPRDRERMIQVLSDSGLRDYYDVLPYDRAWIYRSHGGEIIVDAIWAMANQRTQFDDGWIKRGPETEFLGEKVRVLPVEELIWAKIYILQRQRCDWPDVLNIIHSRRDSIDWDYLLKRMGDDGLLLSGVLAVYQWLCPGDSKAIPPEAWRRVGIAAPSGDTAPPVDTQRVRLVDSRPWFDEPAA